MTTTLKDSFTTTATHLRGELTHLFNAKGFKDVVVVQGVHDSIEVTAVLTNTVEPSGHITPEHGELVQEWHNEGIRDCEVYGAEYKDEYMRDYLGETKVYIKLEYVPEFDRVSFTTAFDPLYDKEGEIVEPVSITILKDLQMQVDSWLKLDLDQITQLLTLNK